MARVTIWDPEGRVLHDCDTLDEAEEIIEEEDYYELTRTYNGRDVNICVSPY